MSNKELQPTEEGVGVSMVTEVLTDSIPETGREVSISMEMKDQLHSHPEETAVVGSVDTQAPRYGLGWKFFFVFLVKVES